MSSTRRDGIPSGVRGFYCMHMGGGWMCCGRDAETGSGVPGVAEFHVCLLAEVRDRHGVRPPEYDSDI